MSIESDKPLFDLITARQKTPMEVLHVHIARDDNRLDHIARALSFFDVKIRLLLLPAWDTDPYARISPDSDIMAQRLASLSRLHTGFSDRPTILVIAAPALLQKVAPPSFFTGQVHTVRAGDTTLSDKAVDIILRGGGYERVSTVRQRGDVCIRGGIIDVFPPFSDYPIRLDRFGDTVESLRAFDPVNQCTIRAVKSVTLSPVREVILNDTSVQKFKEAYRILSHGAYAKDPMYQAIDSQQPFAGMEHWLPLFHGPLVSVMDILPPKSIITQDTGCEITLSARWSMIEHLYNERLRAIHSAALPYYPVAVEDMFTAPSLLEG